MSDLWREPDGATPLTPDEREGLIQAWIGTRGELNEAEQANIARATAWARRRRRTGLLTDSFARMLHLRMFNDVWSWAGEFRRTDKNIGIDWRKIPMEFPAILSDARYWIEHHSYASDEIAVRLHHRIVAIHPFPNGNGRHARLFADLLETELGGTSFTWGSQDLAPTGEVRKRYILALKAADNHDIAPLLEFARS